MSKFVLTAQLQLQAPNNVRQVVNQIQNQLRGGVNVNVNTQGSAQAQRQIQKVTNETNKATNAATRMGKAFGLSIKRFAGLAIATRAVSLFTNTLGEAVREAIAFERELIKISQVTGKTISELRDLTNTITRLSTGLGVSSSQLLKTSRILSQAGFSAREAEIALSSLAKTDLAPTFENIIDTTEGAVAIFNQFKKGAEALESQLGSINAVAGKFAVEAGDLITVIRRTGGVFKAAGGDLNELIALFTSVRSTTRESAESIATGLKTIFTRIQRPKTIEFLRQFGIELESTSGKFVGPIEAVKQLSNAFSGLEEGDLTFVRVGEEIAGFRQIGKVLPLIREFAVAQEALKVAQQGQDSLAKDAATAQLALSVRIVKVKEEFLALVRSISETTAFQTMANTVLSLAEALLKLGEAIKPVLPFIGLLAGVRAFKGLSGFATGLRGGLGGARGFARGGMVPGTGNKDTVPAMLTPGEFVIRKNSVAKLGADNLESMNQYAKGGIVDMSSQDVQKRIYRGELRLTKSRGAAFTDQHQFTENDIVSGDVVTSTKNIKKLENLKGVIGESSKIPILQALSSTEAITQGKGYEDALRVRGAIGSKPPGGIDPVDGEIKGLLGGSQLFEVKRTKKSDNVMLDKALRHIMDNGGMNKKLLRGVDEIDNIKVPPLNQYVMPTNLPDRARAALQSANPKTKKKALGGGISGTDTVPALLTPGEFVVNKKSAQAIGYGSLSRMNKVGKYAKGGIVQEFSSGTGPRGVQPSGVSGVAIGGAVFAFNTAMQGLTPVVEENSSTFTKNTAAIMNGFTTLTNMLIATAGALQLFGVQLNAANVKGVFDLLSSGTGRFIRPLAKSGIGLAKAFGGNAKLFAKLAVGAGRLATGLGLAYVATSALKALADTFFDFDNRMKKAISQGNIEDAVGIAESKQVSDQAFGAVGGGLTGAAIGTMLLPGLGTAIGAAIGGFTGLLLAVDDNAVAIAKSKATLAKADIDLKTRTDAASQSLIDFKKSTDDATTANLQAKSGAVEAEALKSFKAAGDEIKKLSQDQNTIFFNTPTSTGVNDSRISEVNKTSTETLVKALKESQEARDTARESIINRGGDLSDIEGAGLGPDKFFQAANEAFSKSVDRLKRGDKESAAVFRQRADALRAEGERIQNSSENLIRELEAARQAFEQFNLGISQASAAATAANISLQNLQNGLNSSTSGLTSSVNILEASVTEAARGIDAADFDSALNQASQAMLAYGATADEVEKFRRNLTAVADAQKEMPTIMNEVAFELSKTGKPNLDPKARKEAFADAVDDRLKKSNVNEDTRRAIKRELNKDLTKDEVGSLRSGNNQVLQDRLTEIGNTINERSIPALKEMAENDERLASILRKRIDAEQKLVEAQQTAINIFLEARNLEASFGGATVTTSERRRAISARSNVVGRSAGLSDVDGSVESLRRRRQEIGSRFAANQRTASDLSGTSAVGKTDLDGQQSRLKQAQQDQLKTIRDLIKIQQDEIRTIQEKQKLEKASIDSLLSGDIDKFFEQQAAQGAIAAAATGDQRLMDAYGADATGAAAIELRRMKDAGVTEMYGQQIGGRGGLLENTALSGVRARGLRGSAAERSARIEAGTTDEQLEEEKIGRGLAGELAAAGDLGADMAAQDLQTAAQNLFDAAEAIKRAVGESAASTTRGELTGSIRQQDSLISDQSKVVQAARKEAQIKEEASNSAMAAYNKSKYAGMSNEDLLALPTDEYNEARKMKAAAYYDKPMEQKKAEQAQADQEAKMSTLEKQRQDLQKQYDSTGRTIGGTAPAGASLPVGTAFNTGMSMARKMAGDVGAAQGRKQGDQAYFGLGKFFGGGEVGAAEGRRRATETFDQTFGGGSMLDPEAVSQLSDFNSQFSDTVKTLSGLGLDVNLANTSVNVNLQGGEFLKSLTENLKRELLNEIGQNLSGYRPTSTGMSNDGAVLPTS